MFYFKIYNVIILVFIFLLHEGSCPPHPKRLKPSPEETEKMIKECFAQIEEEFSLYPDVIIHARHAVKNIKTGSSCINGKKYVTEYYDSFFGHLNARKIPSIIDFCKSEAVPENDRDTCIVVIGNLFRKACSNNKLNVLDTLLLLRIAFYDMDIDDVKATENKHALKYIDVISNNVQLNLDPTARNNKKFKPPAEFCEEIVKKHIPFYPTAESSSNPVTDD